MTTHVIPVGRHTITIPVTPGKYNVQVSAEGYVPQYKGGLNVTVGPGEHVGVNLGTMRVANPSEEVPSEGDGEKNTAMILFAVAVIVALFILGR